MRALLTLSLLVSGLGAVPAVAQAARTGTFKSDAGWSVTLPPGWKFVEQDDALMAGHDVEAGTILVGFEPGATDASLRQTVTEGLLLQRVRFRARGPARLVPGTGLLLADFDGVGDEGTPLVAISAAMLHPRGAVTVVGLTTAEQEKALRRRVEQTARSVTFAKAPAATAGGDVAALRGALCSYKGGSVSSSTSRATFDGRGGVTLGSETAFGGQITDQYGDDVARFGGASGNQYAPTSGGRYRVEGNRVVIQWGDGATTTCAIHMRQGNGVITELMCDGTLYGAGLCE